jgi:hypothetical protein
MDLSKGVILFHVLQREEENFVLPDSIANAKGKTPEDEFSNRRFRCKWRGFRKCGQMEFHSFKLLKKLFCDLEIGVRIVCDDIGQLPGYWLDWLTSIFCLQVRHDFSGRGGCRFSGKHIGVNLLRAEILKSITDLAEDGDLLLVLKNRESGGDQRNAAVHFRRKSCLHRDEI